MHAPTYQLAAISLHLFVRVSKRAHDTQSLLFYENLPVHLLSLSRVTRLPHGSDESQIGLNVR